MNFRIIGLALLIAMIGMNLLRSLLDVDVPYILTIASGLLGLVALGVHSYQQNRLKNYVLMISVFLLVLVVVAAIQYYVVA
jgi:hypothetical protein